MDRLEWIDFKLANGAPVARRHIADRFQLSDGMASIVMQQYREKNGKAVRYNFSTRSFDPLPNFKPLYGPYEGEGLARLTAKKINEAGTYQATVEPVNGSIAILIKGK